SLALGRGRALLLALLELARLALLELARSLQESFLRELHGVRVGSAVEQVADRGPQLAPFAHLLAEEHAPAAALARERARRHVRLLHRDELETQVVERAGEEAEERHGRSSLEEVRFDVHVDRAGRVVE